MMRNIAGVCTKTKGGSKRPPAVKGRHEAGAAKWCQVPSSDQAMEA